MWRPFPGGNGQESLTRSEERGVGSTEAGKQLLIKPSIRRARATPDTSRPWKATPVRSPCAPRKKLSDLWSRQSLPAERLGEMTSMVLSALIFKILWALSAENSITYLELLSFSWLPWTHTVYLISHYILNFIQVFHLCLMEVENVIWVAISIILFQVKIETPALVPGVL